jgi:hypothetical protein
MRHMLILRHTFQWFGLIWLFLLSQKEFVPPRCFSIILDPRINTMCEKDQNRTTSLYQSWNMEQSQWPTVTDMYHEKKQTLIYFISHWDLIVWYTERLPAKADYYKTLLWSLPHFDSIHHCIQSTYATSDKYTLAVKRLILIYIDTQYCVCQRAYVLQTSYK